MTHHSTEILIHTQQTCRTNTQLENV